MAIIHAPLRIRLLHDIAERILSREDVRHRALPFSPFEEEIEYGAAAYHFAHTAKVYAPLTIESDIEYPAALLALRGLPAPQPERHRDHALSLMEPTDPLALVRRRYGMLREYRGSVTGNPYPALIEIFAEIREGGFTDKQIAAETLKVFQGTPPLEVNPVLGGFLGDLVWLLFGLEPARNAATVLTTPMMLELIHSQGMRFDEFFEDARYQIGLGGGLYPMSVPGAGGDAPEVIDEVAAREAMLLRIWAQARHFTNREEAGLLSLAQAVYPPSGDAHA